MPDQFDVQRKMDLQAQDQADTAHDKLQDVHDKAQERLDRLVKLDAFHYFDPQNQQVLQRVGNQFTNLGHQPDYLKQASEMVEEEARQKGYTPIQGNLFWDKGGKQLFVKNGDHYVLYARDRRKEGERA